MHCISQEKAEEIRQDILAGFKNYEITKRRKCSPDSVTKQRKILAANGLIPSSEKTGDKKTLYMSTENKIEWEKVCRPIRRYYERLRNEQKAKKEPGEIKQIRLVPTED